MGRTNIFALSQLSQHRPKKGQRDTAGRRLSPFCPHPVPPLPPFDLGALPAPHHIADEARPAPYPPKKKRAPAPYFAEARQSRHG